ncbi:MAG: rhodanese-like domain-containing protein [Reyranella sp.]|uniref:rhodanese-like domain-containing protein n=1 Tax=Reyranella sp. TaxID=1929291 RepID=UPI003D140883
MSNKTIAPQNLKQRLRDIIRGNGHELAFLDVREDGQRGMAHPLLSVGLHYSTLEVMIGRLVPRRSTPIVLMDGGDGVSERAARRLAALGYSDIALLGGGVEAWKSAGYELFMGHNVVSKSFGELVEHACHTPSISAEELKAMQDRGDRLVVLDGRTPEEHHRQCLPGGISVPNGELVYRVHDLAPDADTTVVVNCAGRTRSIIGAQTLRNAGIPNKVVAFRNGTMGWTLAGFTPQLGSTRSFGPVSASGQAQAQQWTAGMKNRYGVRSVDRKTLDAWRHDANRTTFLFDVRDEREYSDGHVPGALSIAGGQLVQTTDEWMGVRGARVVLTDDTGVRASITAHWLVQMGWDAYVLEGGIGSGPVERGPMTQPVLGLESIATPQVTPGELRALIDAGDTVVLDAGPGLAYRKTHIPGAIWACRPQLAKTVATLGKAKRIVLASPDAVRARLASVDLRDLTEAEIAVLEGGTDAWASAGFSTEESSGTPSDEEIIDHLVWVAGRRTGNQAEMKQYLEWEQQLVGQLERDGDVPFRIVA